MRANPSDDELSLENYDLDTLEVSFGEFEASNGQWSKESRAIKLPQGTME
jgi:hypothetical protein